MGHKSNKDKGKVGVSSAAKVAVMGTPVKVEPVKANPLEGLDLSALSEADINTILSRLGKKTGKNYIEVSEEQKAKLDSERERKRLNKIAVQVTGSKEIVTLKDFLRDLGLNSYRLIPDKKEGSELAVRFAPEGIGRSTGNGGKRSITIKFLPENLKTKGEVDQVFKEGKKACCVALGIWDDVKYANASAQACLDDNSVRVVSTE